MTDDLAQIIRQAALDAGFTECGIIALDEMGDYIAETGRVIDQTPESRPFFQMGVQSVQTLREKYPWAKSLIIASTRLGTFRYPASLQGMYAKSFFISRDSDKTGPEYQKKLTFASWLDTQTIRWTGSLGPDGHPIWGLRFAAQKAGLGIIRKNHFLYDEAGSFLELDAFLIDRECRLVHHKEIPPCPENCIICRKNCPTGALGEPFTFNPFHCVSFLTTFAKGSIPPELDEAQLGRWMVGCDTCQDVCPFNRTHNWNEGADFPGLNEMAPHLAPEQILTASEEELRKIALLTQDHIQPDEFSTLQTNARRILRRLQRKN